MLKRILILLIFSSLSIGNVQPQPASSVTVKDAWIQQAPPSQKITAGFMTIENHSTKDIALVSAATDICKVVELHKIVTVNEKMSMQKVDQVIVPAQGQAEFKPGGYHLMLIGLTRPLKENEEIQVKLQFAGNIQKIVRMTVKNRESMN